MVGTSVIANLHLTVGRRVRVHQWDQIKCLQIREVRPSESIIKCCVTAILATERSRKIASLRMVIQLISTIFQFALNVQRRPRKNLLSLSIVLPD